MLNNEQRQLVLDNQKLITYCIKRQGLLNNYDEYYGIASIGLIKAAKSYCNDKGYNFSTYAVKCITNEIFVELRNNNSMKRKINSNAISLETEVKQDEKNITLMDTISSDINIEHEIIKKEEKELLYKSLKVLNNKESMIVIYTYGLFNKDTLTQYELAQLFNLSQAQISRLKNSAIRKIKKYCREKNNYYEKEI
jgi:RNA polymerase sporulation-specific sigma factor